MHKRLVNHCTIELSLIPDGPILIKSGKEGADPTKPDMEFVETYHAGGKTVYLPGSSLKGAIRAHAERIVRTVGGDRPDRNHPHLPWASDPLKHNDDEWKGKSGAEIYSGSSFTDQLFGHTSLSSRLRVTDAYPVGPLKLEERNGVAIDRVFGSVAVGPFNYQVCTAGEFKTKIHLKNFTLPQLALVGLVLRDLNEGWFGLGFAKSRGLGTVQVKYYQATVQYPGCMLADGDRIQQLGHEPCWPRTTLLGAGEFLEPEERQRYGFPANDFQRDLPVAARDIKDSIGVELVWMDGTVTDLFQRAMQSWKQQLGVAA